MCRNKEKDWLYNSSGLHLTELDECSLRIIDTLLVSVARFSSIVRYSPHVFLCLNQTWSVVFHAKGGNTHYAKDEEKLQGETLNPAADSSHHRIGNNSRARALSQECSPFP